MYFCRDWQTCAAIGQLKVELLNLAVRASGGPISWSQSVTCEVVNKLFMRTIGNLAHSSYSTMARHVEISILPKMAITVQYCACVRVFTDLVEETSPTTAPRRDTTQISDALRETEH